MRKNDNIFLRHMLDAADESRRFILGKNRPDLTGDRELTLALVKSIEIIGEAANKISPEYCELNPQIPWRNIIGMRNRLIHAYFDINLDILWQTVVDDLPPLIEELEKIVPRT